MKHILFLLIFGFSLSVLSKNLKSLVILAPDPVQYQVEIADTPQKQQIGLMFRSSLPVNKGMFFLFSKQDIIHMWMKNTFIPLDMLFIDNNQTIVHIHENATPFDESIISSQFPASSVLELNAGQVQKHHIKTGMRIKLD